MTAREAAHQAARILSHAKEAPAWFGEFAVLLYEYNARPISPGRQRQEECHLGHPMEGDNLRILPDGRRQCNACAVMRSAKWRERQKRGAA